MQQSGKGQILNFHAAHTPFSLPGEEVEPPPPLPPVQVTDDVLHRALQPLLSTVHVAVQRVETSPTKQRFFEEVVASFEAKEEEYCVKEPDRFGPAPALAGEGGGGGVNHCRLQRQTALHNVILSECA